MHLVHGAFGVAHCSPRVQPFNKALYSLLEVSSPPSDVLSDYTKRFSESENTISPQSSSETRRNEFNNQFQNFKSRNQCINEPATIALLTKIASLVSPAVRLIVQKAWLKSVGLSASESCKLADRINSTGETGCNATWPACMTKEGGEETSSKL